MCKTIKVTPELPKYRVMLFNGVSVEYKRDKQGNKLKFTCFTLNGARKLANIYLKNSKDYQVVIQKRLESKTYINKFKLYVVLD